MRESAIELYLCSQVRKHGGIAYKFTSPGRRSVPDRIVLWPCGEMQFVECKAPGEKPTPLQQREHDKLRAMKFMVNVVDSFELVDTLIEFRPR